MHTKIKGNIAEMSVAVRLIEKGWEILFPVGENCRYDIVAERNGRFVRVQVKYVTPKNGFLVVNCSSNNNWSILPYTEKEVDVLAVYDAINKNIYFIPVKRINRSKFNLRIEPTKNNQKAKVNMVDEFLDLK